MSRTFMDNSSLIWEGIGFLNVMVSRMKWISVFSLIFLVAACQEDLEPEERSNTYLLHRAGYEPVKGEVIFTELGPARIEVRIQLENTDERYDFPAHLHFGGISEVGELAFRLENVIGATGESYTILDQIEFSNGELFTFETLENMNGSVKIHLSDGLFKHHVLSYGNIGSNENYFSDGVAVCTGH